MSGTAANPAQAATNVGQVIELVGTNFNAGTQVQFTTRDNAGNTSVVAVSPLLVNASGTRLQVIVPELASTGDVRVSNLGTRNLGFSSYTDALHRGQTLSFTASADTAVIRFTDGGLENSLDNESWGLDNVVVRQGATTVFTDDFEAGAKSNWSNTTTDGSNATFSRFSGA